MRRTTAYETQPDGTLREVADPPERVELVQVVRCRDCRFRVERGSRSYCDAHAGGFPEVAPDDFCAWGERRDA